MKFHQENFDAKLRVIPLWPIPNWGNSKDKSEENGSTFRELKLELRANPKDTKSNKFGAYFKVFETGTPEQWCRWRDDIKRAWEGLNNTTGGTKAATVRHLLDGQARDDFDLHLSLIEEEGEEVTEGSLSAVLKKVAVNFFPADSVISMKQYLHYEAKKPTKLNSRETATRLQQINNWMDYFPSDGGDRTEKVPVIGATELSLIYYRLLPQHWRRKMEENNLVNMHKSSLLEIIECAERLEVTEGKFENKGKQQKGNAARSASKQGPTGHPASGSSSNGKPESGSAKGSGNFQKKNKQTDCRIHGDNCGHGSHNCKVLMAHAEKVRGIWQAQAPTQKKGPYKKPQNYKNKPSTEERSYSRKEVQTLLKKMESRLNTHENNKIETVDSDDDVEEKMEEYLEELLNS
jgi:hypothetical protein